MAQANPEAWMPPVFPITEVQLSETPLNGGIVTASLDALDAPSQRTIQAFMQCYQDRNTAGLSSLFVADATFHGIFSGGVLRGSHIIVAHLRQHFRGIFRNGTVLFLEVTVDGRQVGMTWALAFPDETGEPPIQAHTTLELTSQGLIEKVRVKWERNPVLSVGKRG